MSARLEEIAARKEALIVRSMHERNDIAHAYFRWQARTQMARQVTAFFRNPWVLAGLGMVALKLPWRRTFKWSGWVWRGWKLWQSVRRMV
jgi:hypothetical protein